MPIPSAPTLDSAVPGVGRIVLAYTQTSPADVDYVEVEFRVQGAPGWEGPRTTSNPTSYVLGGLDAPVSYDVRVRAVSNASGAGPWSTVLTATANSAGIEGSPDFERIIAQLLPRGEAFRL